MKSRPEDFIVEEIMPDGGILEIDRQTSRPDEDGRFVHFVLQKKDWATSAAIMEIAKRLRCSHKKFNFAGTKDKTAISTQLVSCFQADKEKILSLRIKDIQINGAWAAHDKIRLGSLLGNRFTIRLEGADDSNVQAIHDEIEGRFPNYFGEQRFGSTRRNTHLVGEKLLQDDPEGAAGIFLCGSAGEEHAMAKAARKELEETGDYARALKAFPKHLRLERKMIAYLAGHAGDYAGALKQLPRTTLLLFVHAVQSHVFNLLLSERLAEGELELEQGEYFCGEKLGFPDAESAEAEGWIVGKLIGYETMLNSREKEMMGRLGLDKDSFRLKSLPEIASKGTRRTLLAPLKDFNYSDSIFRFSLPSGSYATMAMREFIKGE